MINIIKLKKTDLIKYINLIKKFRPINIQFEQKKFEKIYDLIFNNNDEIWVYVKDNKFVGTIRVNIEQKFINNFGKVAQIEDLYVDKKYRKLGIGSLLIKKALDVAKEKKCYKCILICDSTKYIFYKKNNFEKRGIHMSQLII